MDIDLAYTGEDGTIMRAGKEGCVTLTKVVDGGHKLSAFKPPEMETLPYPDIRNIVTRLLQENKDRRTRLKGWEKAMQGAPPADAWETMYQVVDLAMHCGHKDYISSDYCNAMYAAEHLKDQRKAANPDLSAAANPVQDN